MKIIIAPNAFKDSLSAIEAAEAMAEGVLAAVPEANIELVPVADGGDGLTEIVLKALDGQQVKANVTDPLGRPIEAQFCYLPDKKTAIIEMAEASGLRLLRSTERNPMLTTTLGTGQMILSALDLGAKRILVGLGGSATNDGGLGMAVALGAAFLDDNSRKIGPIGKNLSLISNVDLSNMDARVAQTTFEAICDVRNPLFGKDGAAYVYGPQKGASAEQVEKLDAGLRNLADILRKSANLDVSKLESAGAAGGSGMGLHAFFGAKLRPGVDIVLDLVNLDDALENADLVLTGEGQIDWQTAFGKAPAGVAQAAKRHKVPCLALAGSIGKNVEELYKVGITAVFSICQGPVPLEQALKHAHQNLAKTTQQVVRSYLSGCASLA